jgi:NAD(P)-dependent dehydrogenase (short-subunit alcohol dehydrogenase family)
MKQEVGEGKELKVEYLILDLASFASVKDFIKTFREKNLPLHILVNNAAVAWIPFSELYIRYLLDVCKIVKSITRAFPGK